VHNKLDDDSPSVAVVEVVKTWINCIKTVPHLARMPVLCFDRYYADNSAVNLCKKEGVSVVCSCVSNRFSTIIDRFESGVTKRGDRVNLWDAENCMVRSILGAFLC